MTDTNDSPVKPGAEHKVKIERFTVGGAGLATIEGVPVRVNGAIPGQEVEIRILKKKDLGWESKVINLIKKSAQQIEPVSDHWRGCGMHNLRYDKQIAAKEDIVRETLEQLTPAEESVKKNLPGRVLKIVPSPQVSHYRNKLELSFGYEVMRTEEKDGKRVHIDENPTIGFHPPGDWARVYQVSDCDLYDEQLPMLLKDVKQFMEKTKLPVYNPKNHKGMLRNLLLRRGVNTGEQMIAFIVQARKKELEPLFQLFMQHFGGRSGLKSLMVMEHFGLNDKPQHPKVHTLVGGNTINERLFDLSFDISPFSFFQTNTLGAEKLYSAIAEAAGLTTRDTVLDAYCGMGTIGQYLSRYCDKVVGIESTAIAIDDALKSAGKNRIGNISFYKGRVEQVLCQQLKPGGKYDFSVVVLDPPRAGLHPKVHEAVIAHKPNKIIYVSCNVNTFARDLGVFLKKGYDLRAVQPVDMFPHTPHMEIVATLQKG